MAQTRQEVLPVHATLTAPEAPPTVQIDGEIALTGQTPLAGKRPRVERC